MDTDDSNPQKKSTGFSLRKEDIKVIDALKDFERYRDKKAWELAFRAISGVAEGESKGMVPSKDGFFVPMRRQIWRSLASLPPEGREAYRLFYDAKGKQAFETLVNKPVEEATDLASLRKVVEQYFVTSVGDQAADRLGDMYFEAGDFLAAEGAWASIVSDYPDSDIPKLRLQVKRATALARAGRIEQFEEIAKSIRSDYSGQAVMLGGKEVQTGEYLDGLASAAASTRPAFATTQQSQEQLALPKEEKPLWQMHFVSADLADKVAAAVNNMGWGDFSGIGKFVPATVSDGKRVYVNWIGIIFALEQSSGKLVWRTDKFTDIDSKVQELVQYSVDARRYDLSIVGDKLLAVTAPLRQIQNGLDAYRLMCINPDTGKNAWTSEIGSLSNYDFLGKPLVMGDQIFTVTHTRGAQEMFLTVVNFTTGKMEWNVSLGTPATATNNYRGQPEYPVPVLLHRMGMIYVLTNNGATICVSIPGKRVEWAFTYDMKPLPDQNMWWGYRARPAVETSGVLMVNEGILYIKEQGNACMYALDLSGAAPTLKWKRPVDDCDMLASIDDKQIYLLGEDVAAMDVQTRTLQWSTKLPMQTGLVQPVISNGSIYVFTSRGVYQVDSKSGEVLRIFRGADKESIGGVLSASNGQMISVSNLAVTAYPVSGDREKTSR